MYYSTLRDIIDVSSLLYDEKQRQDASRGNKWCVLNIRKDGNDDATETENTSMTKEICKVGSGDKKKNLDSTAWDRVCSCGWNEKEEKRLFCESDLMVKLDASSVV